MHYQLTDGVLARHVGSTIVLFHPETERLLTLNGSGGRIWELLSEDVEVPQILSRLVEEFEGPAESIRQETLAFLALLETERIICWRS